MSNFTEEFLKIFKVDGIGEYSTLAIPHKYQEFVAEILASKFEKTVCFVPEKSLNTKPNIFSTGDVLDMKPFEELGYRRVERVWNRGEYTVLGENIVVWPYSAKYVYRITLFGNEIESIESLESERRGVVEEVSNLYLFGEIPDLVVSSRNYSDLLVIECIPNIFVEEDVVDVGITSLPYFSLLSLSKSSINILDDYSKRGFEIWYLTKDLHQYDKDSKVGEYVNRVFQIGSNMQNSLKEGFLYEKGKLLLLTDSELLGEVNLNLGVMSKNIDPSSVQLLKKIQVGDFVVHEDHGIGKYLGLVQKKEKYIEIGYAGNDRLFVPLYSSEKVMRYIGSGRAKPVLTGLNSGVWKRVSKRAKENVELIAKELLQIYALREVSTTERVLSTDRERDEYWSFVDDFEFSDTEDQYIATKDIGNDFEREIPMDRLLVGDVGFGKTEVAMRASFAVVNSGKQVAVLAPTTVLANQHLRVFRDRFRKYPFNISLLSRLQSKKEREEIEEGTVKGTIDILIGTHALLSDAVKFKNLGLLVVDEEQKFGVRQKEKLKSSRVDTHVLSMTATPIPRTLNLSLMGVRDISVLAIPPVGRKNIKNEFGHFSFEKVRECIVRELRRDGQVYYLHNRIENIYLLEEGLRELIPDMRIEVVHGRLSSKKLIEVMDRFLNHNIDVLLCTTIIENGLDISNANTLIVDDVNRLGLSQMYQIRGRVGRGSTQAYACFFYDGLRGDTQLRLEALKESEALGSGFILSNRDLEIRGAGDILGKKQSGMINSIGYGLYTQLLHDAVERLKGS